MGKKTILVLALAAVASLGATSSAMAAAPKPTDVTDFSAKVSNAKLVIEGLLPDGIEVPGNDPALVGKSINITGTISKSGVVSIAPSGFDFPAVSLEGAIGGISGISADIILGQQATGSLNTATGAFTLPLNLGVQLQAAFGEPNIQCLVRGLSFSFGTGNVTGWTSLFGSPWSGGNFALTGQSALPSIASVPDADCPTAVKALAGGAIPAGTKVALKLVGTTTIGTAYKKPAAGSLSGSANVTVAKGKNVTSAIKVKCATASRDCAGEVSLALASKGVTLSAPYTAKSGKTVSVTLPVSNAQKLALGKKKVTGKVSISVDNGTGALNKAGSVLVK